LLNVLRARRFGALRTVNAAQHSCLPDRRPPNPPHARRPCILRWGQFTVSLLASSI
jgi:hypothetical protein